jgi:hypothetical protein
MAAARERVGKHVPAATDTHATIDELLETVLSTLPVQMGYITRTSGGVEYQLSKFFSEYVTFSINFNMGSLGGTTNIQTKFDLVPRCLKYVWCYGSHSVPIASFHILEVVDLILVDNVLHITPQENSQWG